MNDLRIRLEGSLEIVETGVAELERFRDRLYRGDTTGLTRALRLRDSLEPAREKVAKFAAEDAQLDQLLMRLDTLGSSIEAEVHRLADLRGLALVGLDARAKLLEAERVFFEGMTSPQFGLWAIPVMALALGSVWFIAHLPSDLQGWAVFAMCALFPLIFIPVSRLAPKLRVSNLSLRVGHQAIPRSELERVDIAEGREGLSFVTIVDIRGARRGPVSVKGMPGAFITALEQAHIEVHRVRLTGR